MAYISCPQCRSLMRPGGFRVWQIATSIILFPAGLLSLLAGRKPAQCGNCGFRFLA